jgi:hypothetical protein
VHHAPQEAAAPLELLDLAVFLGLERTLPVKVELQQDLVPGVLRLVQVQNALELARLHDTGAVT